MGGVGSGRRRIGEPQTDDTKSFIREALGLAERAAPEAMQCVIDRMRKGELVAAREVLDRGLGKATSKVDVSVQGQVLVLTAEDYLRAVELRAAHEVLALPSVTLTGSKDDTGASEKEH